MYDYYGWSTWEKILGRCLALCGIIIVFSLTILFTVVIGKSVYDKIQGKETEQVECQIDEKRDADFSIATRS